MPTDLETTIFRALWDKRSEGGVTLGESEEAELTAVGITKDKLARLVENNYYYSPLNLLRGQLLLSGLAVVTLLTVAAVKFGDNLASIAIFTGIGALVAIPFGCFYIFMRARFSLQVVEFTSNLSFIYLVLSSSIFLWLTTNQELPGLTIIPAIVLVTYTIELRKFAKLKQMIISVSSKSSA